MHINILEKYRKEFSTIEIPILYQYQGNAINKLLKNENCLVIVPTGGGKSLIFQLVGLEKENTTLIISPLKALMHEQVDELNSKGIPALAITSDIPFQDQRKILRNLGSSNFKFIFVSPERLQNLFFRSALLNSNRKIDQLVIDEAHCISLWGFDFRPEYAEIISFIDFLHENNQKPVICALTATLSQKAANDIKSNFKITEGTIYSDENLIRQELKLNFRKIEDKGAEETKWVTIIDFIKQHKSKKILIYFYSKIKSEELAKKFNSEKPINDFVADFFHAGLSSSEKLSKYKLFKDDQINLLFTTTAFGMGMNIPNIDCIIQYHLPKSIEDYYQQVGRGARVKEICPECNCLLFWSEKNINENIKEIKSEQLTTEKVLKGFEHLGLDGETGNYKSITYSELNKAEINLPKLKYYLEKLNIIETIGEINGGPDTIRFKRDTPLWLKIKQNALGNSFIIASIRMKQSLQSFIDHVYNQELKGNVDYLPAMDKKLFIKELGNFNDVNVINSIVNDSNEKLQFQLGRFNELENLCRSNEPIKYLSQVFNEIG